MFYNFLSAIVTPTPSPTPGPLIGSALDAVKAAIHKILTGESTPPTEAQTQAWEIFQGFGTSVKEIAVNFDSVFQIFFPFLSDSVRGFIYIIIGLWALFLIGRVGKAIKAGITGGILS